MQMVVETYSWNEGVRIAKLTVETEQLDKAVGLVNSVAPYTQNDSIPLTSNHEAQWKVI